MGLPLQDLLFSGKIMIKKNFSLPLDKTKKLRYYLFG
jgi:hypothetical protein